MKKHRYTSDKPMEIAFEFIGMCMLVLWSLIALSMCGCTKAQWSEFQSSVVTVSECALHTSLGCASQAAAGCTTPSSMNGYGEYGQCLVDKSASCSGRGLGLCLLKGIGNAVGSTSVAAGGVGCTGDEGMSEVRHCVADVTLETESEAVSAVAACYRRVCLEGPRGN
tara:strand:- start:4191 stop:4691 length:501 start_codon:yes stop_codon:yes gene_type:complete